METLQHLTEKYFGVNPEQLGLEEDQLTELEVSLQWVEQNIGLEEWSKQSEEGVTAL